MLKGNGEEDGYGQFPKWIRGKVTGKAFAVFADLCTYASRRGVCWPSVATLAEDTGLSKDSVRRGLNELRDKGMIRWQKQARDDGGNSSNIYQVRMWDEGAPEFGANLNEFAEMIEEEQKRKQQAEKNREEVFTEPWPDPLTLTAPTPSSSQHLPPSAICNTNKTNRTELLEQSNSQLSASAEEPTPIQTELLDYLDAQIVDAGFSKPNRTKKNTSAVRLLLEKDGKTPEQVKACIDFTFRDEFWRTNIRSMSKLREKWDQLKGARDREVAKRDPRNNLTRGQRAAATDMERYMRQREEQRQIGGLL